MSTLKLVFMIVAICLVIFTVLHSILAKSATIAMVEGPNGPITYEAPDSKITGKYLIMMWPETQLMIPWDRVYSFERK